MRVLIAGGSGLIGSRLVEILRNRGFEPRILSRKRLDNGFVWNPEKLEIDPAAVDWADAIVNLAGAGIVEKRWTKNRKRELIESRTIPTRLLRRAISESKNPPKIYLGASAIGIYGDRGDEILNEKSALGPRRDFMVDCCEQWENAHFEIEKLGLRVAVFRVPVVFSTRGGALPELIRPVRFGVSPVFGDGKMWQSWAHIDDLCGQFAWALDDEKVAGTFDSASPNSLIVKDLAQKIRSAMGRSWAVAAPVPRFFLRLVLGEMSAVLLNSNRTSSQKIEAAGFLFSFPKIEDALEDLLRRKI